MDDFQVSLGTPDTLPVDRTGDKGQGNRKQHRPDNKDKKKNKLLAGADEIILSSDAESIQNVSRTSEKPKDRLPAKGKGGHIDLTA